MSCDRFWREGIRRVEEGAPDPHRDACAACRGAFESYQHLADALRTVATSVPGAADWQARVHRELRGLQRAATPRWRGWLAVELGAISALVAVCLVAAASAPPPPRVEIVSGAAASSSRDADVGARVRVTAPSAFAIRIYRRDHLVVQAADDPVVFGAPIRVVELALELPGVYHVVVVESGARSSAPTLDPDLATLRRTGVTFQVTELTVR